MLEVESVGGGECWRWEVPEVRECWSVGGG